jgi:hypothetical protein
MSFYDNLNNYFEKDKNIIKLFNKLSINKLQSNIIKEYHDILNDTDEYFEDRIMEVFDEYINRCENEDMYDNICNHIILIYYKSIVDLKKYYSKIYKKKKILL